MSTDKYTEAINLIDAAHSQDPNTITINGETTPYELHYARKMTYYLNLRCPNASQILRVAIRAQHFRRWEIPRASYPMTKVGYLSWRAFLKKRQAELASAICIQCDFRAEDAEEVARLIRKEGLKGSGEDGEAQILEDVACLVFLDDQFEGFEKEWDEEKVLGILRKTWGKMSGKGHELALQMEMDGRGQELIAKALAG